MPSLDPKYAHLVAHRKMVAINSSIIDVRTSHVTCTRALHHPLSTNTNAATPVKKWLDCRVNQMPAQIMCIRQTATNSTKCLCRSCCTPTVQIMMSCFICEITAEMYAFSESKLNEKMDGLV
uniref:Uncharacterized protein n=1 Tax=Hordeum vulgare subsp. vulgare TaxID=112509 RepID=A0A8I6ZEH8_HORVV